MIYNFKNLPVSFDGVNFFTDNVSLDTSAQIGHDRKIDNSIDYSVGDGIDSSMQFSYYVTGADIFYNKSFSDLAPISGNVGGVYFNHGYLSSHSVQGQANGLIVANVTLRIYDGLQGKLTTGRHTFNDLQIGHANGSEISNHFGQDNILSFDLSTSLQHSVDYNYESEIPHRVSATEVSTNMTLQGTNLGPYLSWSGHSGSSEINIRSSNGTQLQQYGVTGQVNSKNLSVAPGNILNGSVTLTQAR